MLKIYKTTSVEKKIKKAKKATIDSWIDMVSPTRDEIDKVVKITGIEEDLILKMLDDEEKPRIEEEKNATLIVIDTPYLEVGTDHFSYTTRPLGIIVTKNNYMITVAPKNIRVLTQFKKNQVKEFRTAKKTRFVIQILLKTSSEYLNALKVVNTKIEEKEEAITNSTSNKDLINMLELEKTLVYFITSLKSNDLVLNRLAKGVILPLYEGDDDLLEDALIENRQAIELSGIYRDILSSITDTYATVVSNNLNQVMKFLAAATIVLSVPTMIFSFFGMNVALGGLDNISFAWMIILGSSLLISLIIVLFLYKKNIF